MNRRAFTPTSLKNPGQRAGWSLWSGRGFFTKTERHT